MTYFEMSDEGREQILVDPVLTALERLDAGLRQAEEGPAET